MKLADTFTIQHHSSCSIHTKVGRTSKGKITELQSESQEALEKRWKNQIGNGMAHNREVKMLTDAGNVFTFVQSLGFMDADVLSLSTFQCTKMKLKINSQAHILLLLPPKDCHAEITAITFPV
jgi:hypothetical protein